jgi:hypothetical protein
VIFTRNWVCVVAMGYHSLLMKISGQLHGMKESTTDEHKVEWTLVVSEVSWQALVSIRIGDVGSLWTTLERFYIQYTTIPNNLTVMTDNRLLDRIRFEPRPSYGFTLFTVQNYFFLQFCLSRLFWCSLIGDKSHFRYKLIFSQTSSLPPVLLNQSLT